MKVVIDTEDTPEVIAEQINAVIGRVFVTPKQLAELKGVEYQTVRNSPNTYAKMKVYIGGKPYFIPKGNADE